MPKSPAQVVKKVELLILRENCSIEPFQQNNIAFCVTDLSILHLMEGVFAGNFAMIFNVTVHRICACSMSIISGLTFFDLNYLLDPTLLLKMANLKWLIDTLENSCKGSGE